LNITARAVANFATALGSRSAIVLLPSAWILAVVVYDGDSTWEEGAILVGFYVVIAASFWWGA